MRISITYSSRRSEVWQWYWRTWRRGLWKTHCLVFVAVASAASILIFDGVPKGFYGLPIVALIGVVPLIGFVLFPMLNFKPQLRTLIVDEHGIGTTIGRKSGTIPWEDIADVREDGDCLIVQRRNLNSFIVPSRAFQTNEAKSQFYDFVRAKVLISGS